MNIDRPFTSATGRGVPTRVFTAVDSMRQLGVPTLQDTLTRPACAEVTELVAGQPVVDSGCRVGLGKVAANLGWSAGEALSATIRGSRVVVTGAGTTPKEGSIRISLKLDQQKRATLPPAVLHALGVSRGQQLQVVADPTTGQLTLLSLTGALAILIGSAAA